MLFCIVKYFFYILGCAVLLSVLYFGIAPIFMTSRLDETAPTASPQEIMGGAVIGTVGHPAEGTARIVRDGARMYLRYENFKTLNGPDLFIYLATDESATEFVNLGRLKATEGNINYEIPAGTDLSKYRYVLTWCRAFSVLFNSSKLPSLQ